MNAAILSVGDELVLGLTIDTNSAWMSQQLSAVGCDVVAHATVSDDKAAIVREIKHLAERVELLVVSGGIGPTDDDLTREALAEVLGVPLEMDAAFLARLEGFFAARGRPMKPGNRKQALYPRGHKLLDNPVGTAGCLDATLGNTRIIVVPGVPKEMKRMVTDAVLPIAAGSGRAILGRTLHTFGLGESDLAALLGEMMDRTRNPTVGTTVAEGVVSVRLYSRGSNREQAVRMIDETDAAVRGLLGSLIFGTDGQPLADAVGQLLIERGKTIATAESCTGGTLAGVLTDISGSSEYFRNGYVTYANAAKTAQLGVPAGLIAQHGAVSREVAEAMAAGARDRSGDDYAIAITGIAGPEGGTEAKPVGTVWIALAEAGSVVSRKWVFPGDRAMIRDRSAKMALTLLRYRLLEEALPF